MAHRFGGHFGVRIGLITGRKQTLLAEPALATADGERHHYPVPDLEVGDLGPERHDLAHVLVAEDVAGLHGGLVAIQQVKVRPADRAGGYFDDRIARVLDLGIRDGVDTDIAFTVPA